MPACMFVLGVTPCRYNMSTLSESMRRAPPSISGLALENMPMGQRAGGTFDPGLTCHLIRSILAASLRTSSSRT